jgi:hypothetical protein
VARSAPTLTAYGPDSGDWEMLMLVETSRALLDAQVIERPRRG